MNKIILFVGILCVVGCTVPHSYDWKNEQHDYAEELRKQTDAAFYYVEAGDLEGAATICKQVLEAEPNYARGYWVLGLVSAVGKEYDKGAMFVGRSIQLLEQDEAIWSEISDPYRDNRLLLYKATKICFDNGYYLDSCAEYKSLPPIATPR